MKILVACEESQVVTIAFRNKGQEAFSCDIEPCSGGHPEWHIQGDVIPLLQEKWDMIIAFPPCTYLTVTGNRWFNIEKYGEKAIERKQLREDALVFFMRFINAPCNKIAIENPVGIVATRHRKPNQIIQPYYFGDPYEKKTCLWLKNLPNLKPTNHVTPEPRRVFQSGKTMPPWYADCWHMESSERARARSKTFQGIANAMAEQWG